MAVSVRNSEWLAPAGFEQSPECLIENLAATREPVSTGQYAETCLCCGNADFQRPYARLIPWVNACLCCGVQLADPQPSQAELDRIYSEDYFETFGFANQTGSVVSGLKAAWFAEILDMAPPYTGTIQLLDVGAGRGDLLSAAGQRGWSGTGVEPIPLLSDVVFEEQPWTMLRTSIEDAEFPDATFDIITCLDVLEHIRNPLVALTKMSHWLKPEGTLLLTTINRDGLLARLSGRFWPHYHRDHLWYFSERSLLLLLERSGFTIRHCGVPAKRYHVEYLASILRSRQTESWPARLAGVLLRCLPQILRVRQFSLREGLLIVARRADGWTPSDAVVSVSADGCKSPCFSEDDQTSVLQSSRMPRQARSGYTHIELIIVITVLAVLVALLLPAVQAAREAARRSECRNHLKQIGLALHSYHDAHRVVPLNYGFGTFDETDGGASWMQMLLPYLDQEPRYRGIQFGSPLTDVGNRAIAETAVSAFLCPSDSKSSPVMDGRSNVGGAFGVTNYAGCLGSNWNWGIWSPVVSQTGRNSGNPDGLDHSNGLFSRGGNSRPEISRWSSVRDGQSTTFAIGETVPAWTAHAWWYWFNGTLATCAIPLNVLLEPEQSVGDWHNHNGFKSNHRGGAHFCLCDGSVRFVSESIDQNVYRAAATIDAEEVVSSW